MSNPIIARYCEEFARTFSVEYAFAFWKGRVALYAILKAMGVGPGDEVIVPGYTCVMSVSPILYLGAKAVFVDIEPQTFNMDVNQLESKITSRTRLIVAQHTYGYVADLDAILDIASRRAIPVIEDCCLSPGSRYKGRLTGTFTPASYFSTQWNKTFTTGLGGVAICHDDNLAGKIQQICDKELIGVPWHKAALLAMELALYRSVIFPQTTEFVRRIFRWLVHHNFIDGSSSPLEITKPELPKDFFRGFSSVQARSGLRQLRRLRQNIEHRKKMVGLYEQLLRQRGWKVITPPPNTDPVLVRYPIRITNKWQAIEKALQSGIELGAWFEQPLHPKEPDLELYGYRWGSCPQAEKAAWEVVNLPLHLRVSEKTARRTVEFLCQFEQAG
jgi:dTDP-4-amino-4,6-dideoxygalactose transaminase